MTLDHKRQQGDLYLELCLTFCVDASLNINIAGILCGFVSERSRALNRCKGETSPQSHKKPLGLIRAIIAPPWKRVGLFGCLYGPKKGSTKDLTYRRKTPSSQGS